MFKVLCFIFYHLDDLVVRAQNSKPAYFETITICVLFGTYFIFYQQNNPSQHEKTTSKYNIKINDTTTARPATDLDKLYLYLNKINVPCG